MPGHLQQAPAQTATTGTVVFQVLPKEEATQIEGKGFWEQE